MNGANLNARAATGAKCIINGCQVAFYLNSAVGARLLALHAADTTVGANFACNRALIVIRALNNNLNGIVNKLDDVVGTFANTHAATNTFLRIYLCNSVFNVDRISGANIGAVTVTQAGINAGFVAVIHKVPPCTTVRRPWTAN